MRRLSLRRQNCLSERRFFEEERERGLYLHDGPHYVSGLVHSDSIMSLGSHQSWASRPYLPDKLQIVKPLEGDPNPNPNPFSHPNPNPNSVSYHNPNPSIYLPGKLNIAKTLEDDPEAKRSSNRSLNPSTNDKPYTRRNTHPNPNTSTNTSPCMTPSSKPFQKASPEQEGGLEPRPRQRSPRRPPHRTHKRPPSFMLFNSLWSVMHHSKNTRFTHKQARRWLDMP